MNDCSARLVVVGSFAGAALMRPDLAFWRAALEAPDRVVEARGADTAAQQMAGAGIWALCCWVALCSALLASSRLPGLLGSAAGAAARRTAPTFVRRALAGALGTGMIMSPAAAFAEPAPTPSAAWPLSGAPVSGAPDLHPVPAPSPAWPTSSGQPDSEPEPGPAPEPIHAPIGASATTVVVQPGDSLWSLAARALGPDAANADVAAAWPIWYRANSAVIGADPQMIRPGMALTAPAAAPAVPAAPSVPAAPAAPMPADDSPTEGEHR